MKSAVFSEIWQRFAIEVIIFLSAYAEIYYNREANMINKNTALWIENLAPRLRDYLKFTDRMQEAAESSDLSERARYYFGTGLLEDFFGSDYYNPDFDPGPEEGVKIKSVRDLSDMVESADDREKLENSISAMLDRVSGKTADEGTAEDFDPSDFNVGSSDPVVSDFFNMMTDSIQMQGFYDGMESEIQKMMSDWDGSDLDDEVEEHAKSHLSGNLDDLLADMLDGHIDTGDDKDR